MLLGFPASTTKSWQGEKKLLLFDLVSLFPVPSWIYPLLLYRQWKLKNSKQLFWHIQSCYTWVLRVSGFCAAAKVKQEDFIFSFYCRLYLCWNKTRSGWNFLLAAPWREGAELDLVWLLLTKKLKSYWSGFTLSRGITGLFCSQLPWGFCLVTLGFWRAFLPFNEGSGKR